MKKAKAIKLFDKLELQVEIVIKIKDNKDLYKLIYALTDMKSTADDIINIYDKEIIKNV